MADLLRTDYKDDVLNAEVNTRRKYQMITNDDGTISFVDVTDYSQVGDSFGGAVINAQNEALANQSNQITELNNNLKIVKNNVSKNTNALSIKGSVETIIYNQSSSYKSAALNTSKYTALLLVAGVNVNGNLATPRILETTYIPISCIPAMYSSNVPATCLYDSSFEAQAYFSGNKAYIKNAGSDTSAGVAVLYGIVK